MWRLSDDTHPILDGEVRVYQRERSKRWQAAFVIDGHTIRISTTTEIRLLLCGMECGHSGAVRFLWKL